MKIKINSIILFAFLFFVIQPLRAEKIRFINGFWFDGRGFKSKTVYSVDGRLSFDFKGRIDSTVDLKQTFVIPPFAEAHTHQFLDVMNFQEQIEDYLGKGIFYAKNVNSLPRFTVRIRPFINRPTSVDVIYANGGLTATGGHPVQIYDYLGKNGIFRGVTAAEMENEAYFIIDDEPDLARKWPKIIEKAPDLIKTYLDHSEEYETRRTDSKYYGTKGLNPELLPKIVEKAHRNKLRVSTHITTAQDFHHAVKAGVDEISHLPLEPISAADAKLCAAKKIFVVTTTLSHRDTGSVPNIREIHYKNLKLLQDSGVRLALGTDNMPTSVVEEAENIYALKVLDTMALLKIWTENTARTIFPNRRIGFLRPGFEASFLALAGNPLDDFSSIRKIAFRYKQGQSIKSRSN